MHGLKPDQNHSSSCHTNKSAFISAINCFSLSMNKFDLSGYWSYDAKQQGN